MSNEVLHQIVADSLKKYRLTSKTKVVHIYRYRTRFISNTYIFISRAKDEKVSGPDTLSYNPGKQLPVRNCSLYGKTSH